jgi:hypothetical protein
VWSGRTGRLISVKLTGAWPGPSEPTIRQRPSETNAFTRETMRVDLVDTQLSTRPRISSLKSLGDSVTNVISPGGPTARRDRGGALQSPHAPDALSSTKKPCAAVRRREGGLADPPSLTRTLTSIRREGLPRTHAFSRSITLTPDSETETSLSASKRLSASLNARRLASGLRGPNAR